MTPFLSGKKILLTRPRRQAEETRSLFESLGADVLHQPAFEVLPAKNLPIEELSPAKLASYDRIIFSSGNGVFFFLNALLQADQKEKQTKRLQFLQSIPIAAVGPGTESELKRFNCSADVVPELHSAEGIVGALAEEAKRGSKFLSVRGDRGRDVLREGLTALGGSFYQLSVYRTEEIKKPDDEIARLLDLGKIDFTLITSSAVGKGIVRLFGDSLKKTKLVSISPLTSSTLVKLGFAPEIEASEAAISGIVNALKNFILPSHRWDFG